MNTNIVVLHFSSKEQKLILNGNFLLITLIVQTTIVSVAFNECLKNVRSMFQYKIFNMDFI